MRNCVLPLALTAVACTLSAQDIDLSGPWKLKDFSIGMGVQRKAFDPAASRSGYLNVAVPTTERAALLAAGEIPDPYLGTNNERTLWPEEKEWWFIREFTLPESTRGRSIDLVFEGIVYQGEAWINGKPLGRMEGMFKPFAFDVARHLKYGGKNVLAVRLEAPRDASKRNLVGGYQYDLKPDRPQLHTIAQSVKLPPGTRTERMKSPDLHTVPHDS